MAPCEGAPSSSPDALDRGWTQAAGLGGGGGAGGCTDEPATRDYWYYVAFVYDPCGNESAVSNRAGGVLNYHLGDVTDGATPGHGDNRVETDNVIQFEDMMVFAINYQQVSKPHAAAPAMDRNEVTLEAPSAVREGGTFEVTVSLTADGSLRGLSVPSTWDASVAEPVGMAPGELLKRQAGPAQVFAPAPGVIDAAGFGAGFAGEGVLATVTFRAVRPGDPGLGLDPIDGRDASNGNLVVNGQVASSRDCGGQLLPVSDHADRQAENPEG